MTSKGDVKLRATFQFCEALGKTPTETYKMIQDTGAVKKCCLSLVFKWHKQFKDGRGSIEDESRCGRPAKLKSAIVQVVKDLLAEDRRFTVRTISSHLGVSKSYIHQILTDDLHMSKVSPEVGDEQKATRVECSTEFLNRFEMEGDQFLDNIITMDETWIWEYMTLKQRPNHLCGKHQEPNLQRKLECASSVENTCLCFYGSPRHVTSAQSSRQTDSKCRVLRQGK